MILEILGIVYIGLITAGCFVVAGIFLKGGEFGLFWLLLIVGLLLLALFATVSGSASVCALQFPSHFVGI